MPTLQILLVRSPGYRDGLRCPQRAPWGRPKQQGLLERQPELTRPLNGLCVPEGIPESKDPFAVQETNGSPVFGEG